MWTIRQEQVNHLEASFKSRSLEERVRSIRDQIREAQPDLTNRSSEHEIAVAIRDALVAASRIGIEDVEDQYEWALRRATVRQNFWEDQRVRSLLDDSLIHPKAKARYALLLSKNDEQL